METTDGSAAGARRYRNPLGRHILIGCLIFIVALCTIVVTIGFLVFRNSMMSRYESHIRNIMDLTMARIDADDLESCIETGEPTEEYGELIEFMDQARQNYEMDYLVIVTPMYEDGRYDVMQVASGLYPEERAGVNQKEIAVPLLGDMIGDFYPPEFIKVIYNDMLTRTDIKFDTSTTEFGRTYDGAVPIRNSAGEGIALLTAGVTLRDIDTTMRRYIIITTVCAVMLSAIFITFMMLWLRRRVIVPLQKLEKSAGDFMEKSAGQTDPDVIVMEDPDIHTGDEIEALANTLVTVSQNTKTYVEDLLASANKMQDMEQEMTTIKADAVKDSLTGVRNKAGYDKVRDRLDWDIINNIADFGLLMVDLNYLKKVNDTYGHEKGDIYIKKLCKMVCDTFDHSPVFRIGGDEFIVILENNDLKIRDELISGLKAEMEALQEDRELAAWERVSAAMGLALYDSELDDNVESVFKRADKAMYENKKAMKAVRTD